MNLPLPHPPASSAMSAGARHRTTQIDLIVKPTGPICNLECSYCFFLSKEMMFPDDRFRMTDQLLDEYITQLLAAQRGQDVRLSWQGGEPTLMGLDFFKRSINLVKDRKRPDQRVSYAIQTNATLITDEWADFLEEHRFLVGVSIDGPQHLHDEYRVDKHGNGSFNRVITGLEKIRHRGIEFNILCTVNAANESHGLEVYRFFRDTLGATHIQFIPIVEKNSTVALELKSNGRTIMPASDQLGTRLQATPQSVNADRFGAFLIEIFNEWIRHDIGSVYVQHFDVALALWHGQPPGLCVFAETCGTAPTLTHNGDVYSCDHFVEPAHKLGNITSTPLSDQVFSEQQQAFGRSKRTTLPQQCLDCEVLFACNGGCPKDRFIETHNGDPGLNYLCAGYKAFFEHIDTPMRLMSELLDMGLPATAIAQLAAPRRTR